MADKDEAEKNPPEAGDTKASLDQGEIDQLVEETKKESEVEFIIHKCDGTKIHSSEKVSIELYDFRNPVFLTEAELRLIRIRQDQFVEYLASRLSMALRLDLGLKINKLHTNAYERFTNAIPDPAYISLFKINQLTGVGVVSMKPRLAMALVNRLLGGKTKLGEEDRALTDIESALMEDVIPLILDEWCQQWKDIRELNAALLGNENSGKFLQTSPYDAIMLIVDLEFTLNGQTEIMQMGVPYYMIEPLIKQMLASNQKYSKLDTQEKKAQWLPKYSDIGIPIKAEWDACKLSVRDLLGLKPGDTIELPKNIMQSTQLRLKNTIHFTGEVGINNERVAVKINEKLYTEE